MFEIKSVNTSDCDYETSRNGRGWMSEVMQYPFLLNVTQLTHETTLTYNVSKMAYVSSQKNLR